MTEPVSGEARLEEVVLAWLEASRAGWAPERSRFLAAYPDLRNDLAEFIEGHAALAGLHGPAEPARHSDELPLGTLGDFRLLREVGRGGMGVVYEAEQMTLRRRVALKVLPFAAALDHRQLERFRNEALAAANLRHDHIVPVFAVGMERGVHFYAMQFIQGQSLAMLVETLRAKRSQANKGRPRAVGTPVSAAEAFADASTQPAITSVTTLLTGTPHAPGEIPLSISRDQAGSVRHRHRWVAELGAQAAGALEHAHQMGVVHRDIKPANLLLDGHGNLWVADFGLARISQDPGLTRTGEILGTLRYASPEQALARPGVVDHRADVYSLGATLYELLTLEPLFDGKDRNTLLAQISRDEPVPPRRHDATIPVELETIVLKATAKERDDRYGSARELAEDLARFLNDLPILARPPTLWERAIKTARRHRAVTLTAGAALTVLLLGLASATVLVTKAYEGERLKAEEADRQRELSENSFRQAREAVEQLVSISEEQLPGVSVLEPLRRRLLEAALGYYEEFIDQAQATGDPKLQAELEGSQAKVRNIVAELTSLAGAARFRHLFGGRMREELALSPRQLEAVTRVEERWRSLFRRNSRGEAPVDLERDRVALAREQEREMENLLDKTQKDRFEQILLQMRGPMALADPVVTDQLGLSADQRKQVRVVLDKQAMNQPFSGYFPGNRDGRGGPPGPGHGGGPENVPGSPPRMPPEGFSPSGAIGGMTLQGDLNKTWQEIREILTAGQRQTWDQMTGKPFRPRRPTGPGPRRDQ